MWCFKCQGKGHTSIVLSIRPNIQEFQYQKFIVYGCDELLQTWDRNPKVNAAHTVVLLECQQYSVFIFSCKVVIFVIVINDEWKRGEMC